MKTLVGTRHPNAGIRWTLFAGVLLAAVLAMTGAPAAHAAGEPTICTISPGSGPAAGGTAVKIEGNNFATATSVTFGGVPAASWTLHGSGWDTCGSDGNYIVAVAPAGTPGSSVQVRVTNVIDDTDAYTTSGNEIIGSVSGKHWAYCVTGDALSYQDTSSTGSREPGIIDLTRR